MFTFILTSIATVSCNRLNVSGAPVSGRYGHSSVLFENKVYVYGGLTARDIKNSQLVDDLYAFNLLNRSW